MKFGDTFKLSTRMFKARTSRTLLTILGMSIGIGAILFLVSLGYGLQKTLLERITTSDSLLTLDVSETKSGTVILDRNMAENIRQMPGVNEISPTYQLGAQGKSGDLSADLMLLSVDGTFLRLGGVGAANGVLINDQQPNGIVISTAVAQVFGKNPADMLGQEIKFTAFVPVDNGKMETNDAKPETREVVLDDVFTVIGVVQGEENTVYANSKALERLEVSRYSQLKVKCNSNGELNVVRNAIMEYGLLVSSLSDTVDQANQIFNVIKFILMLFGIIALVVSAIGMFNTMTIALLERTEEIGIMKCIGASDRDVSVMFFMESSIMGFLGGVSGIVIGWLGGTLFNFLINFIAARFGGESVSLFYSPLWLISIIVFSSVVVGFMTGFVPARRASKTDPLDALRYK